jgi:hypothetical protein
MQGKLFNRQQILLQKNMRLDKRSNGDGNRVYHWFFACRVVFDHVHDLIFSQGHSSIQDLVLVLWSFPVTAILVNNSMLFRVNNVPFILFQLINHLPDNLSNITSPYPSNFSNYEPKPAYNHLN